MITTYGSLFSGVGALDAGFELATGARPSWLAESDPYCRAVLARHWPGVPIHDDVRKVNRRSAPRVDAIIGGFPCQDVSQAGAREGITGERSGLWVEFARVVRVLRPRFVFVENVAGLLVRGFGDVLGDLARLGFDAQWSCLRAADVGAPHLRRRVFVLAALPDAIERAVRQQRQRDRQQHGQPRAAEPGLDGALLADADAPGREGRSRQRPDLQQAGPGSDAARGGRALVPDADRERRGQGADVPARQPDAAGSGALLADAGDDGRSGGGEGHDDDGRDASGDLVDRCPAWPPAPGDADAWARWDGALPGVRRGAYGPPRGLDARRRRARLGVLGNACVPQQAAAAWEGLLARMMEGS